MKGSPETRSWPECAISAKLYALSRSQKSQVGLYDLIFP